MKAKPKFARAAWPSCPVRDCKGRANKQIVIEESTLFCCNDHEQPIRSGRYAVRRSLGMIVELVPK